MVKLFIVLLLGFGLGFITHALYFPDILANGIVDVQKVVLPNTVPTLAPGTNESDFETKITYDGENFSRNNIKIGVGNYLTITNTSPNKPMWLQSNEPALATVRGYGETEAVRHRMDTGGEFVVVDKNNPKEKIVITVK